MVNFERSEAGLLIPKQLKPRAKEPNRLIALINSVGPGTIVNALMVLIQLATIWILWKTYQDTVIPNRQKELLSEQVAKLELEQAQRTKEVSLASRRVKTLNAELTMRHAELLQLSTERQNLLVEATSAQARAERARISEGSARLSASKAHSGLEASQWSIYYQSAASILGLPQLIMIRKVGEVERAGIGVDDPQAAFHAYIKSIESIWPNMDGDAQLVVNELRKDDSKFYPRWMIEEFAAYFTKEADGLSCPKPDFSAIEKDVDNKFDAAVIAADREAREKRQRDTAEGLKKNIRYVFQPGTLEREVKVAVSNATYKMVDKIESDLRESIEKCNQQFDPIGDKFFANKGVSQPTMPSSVFEEFKK